MQGIIGSLDDMDLLRRMLKGGDEEDAIMEAEGRLADLRHRIIEYQNAPAPEWLKKTQDYARMVIEGFGSEYLMEVMPFRLEDRIDIADRLEKELNEIFRAAGIKEEYIKAGKRFAENVLKNTPSKSIYPSFTVLVDIARRLEGEVSNLIIAQFASLLAEMFSNTSDDAALTQI